MNRLSNFIRRKINYVLSVDIFEIFLSIQTFIKLRKIKYLENTVLIIEPNSFHGEILPGYTFYFNKLGYKVTLLVRRENYNQGLFSLFKKDELPNIYCINNLFLKFLFRKKMNFDFVFFTSTMISEKYGYFGHVFSYFKNSTVGKFGTIFTEHNFDSLIPQIEASNVYLNQLTLLSPLKNEKYKSIAVVNPNYFGEIPVGKKLNSKKTFIAVGSINQRNRNIDLLFDMVDTIGREYDDDFEVLIVGRGVEKEMFPNLPKQIVILGELSFNDLFKVLNIADYFLPLLDPTFSGHKRYLNGETTGSKQLILGFSLVPVVHAEFASVYGFSDDNSILYNDNFTMAIKDAILLDDKKYLEKRNNIIDLALEVRAESQKNLKVLLENQIKLKK